jgi:hypothetical protein
MLDGERPVQQKCCISHKIGDKAVPKLHACIGATQSLKHKPEASAGRDLDSWPTDVVGWKSSWKLFFNIYQNLPSLHLWSLKLMFLRTLVWCGLPIKALPPPFSMLGPSSAFSKCFKLSFDPAKNSKDFVCDPQLFVCTIWPIKYMIYFPLLLRNGFVTLPPPNYRQKTTENP